MKNACAASECRAPTKKGEIAAHTGTVRRGGVGFELKEWFISEKKKKHVFLFFFFFL